MSVGEVWLGLFVGMLYGFCSYLMYVLWNIFINRYLENIIFGRYVGIKLVCLF